jgi:hypothetical protein
VSKCQQNRANSTSSPIFGKGGTSAASKMGLMASAQARNSVLSSSTRRHPGNVGVISLALKFNRANVTCHLQVKMATSSHYGVRSREDIMRLSGRLLAGSIAAGAVIFLGLGAAADVPSSLDKLRIWEGHWTLKIQSYKTKYSPSPPETTHGDNQCAWQAHKNWMVCDFLAGEVDPQRGKPDNTLSVLTYSDIDKQYRRLSLGAEGSVQQQVIAIDGNEWVTPWACTGATGVKHFCRHTFTFVSPEKQLFTFEISDDNQHWTLLDNGMATKVG